MDFDLIPRSDGAGGKRFYLHPFSICASISRVSESGQHLLPFFVGEQANSLHPDLTF